MTKISEYHIYELLSINTWKTAEEIKNDYCNAVGLNPKDIIDILRMPESHVISGHLQRLVDQEFASSRYREANEQYQKNGLRLDIEYRKLLRGHEEIIDINKYTSTLESKLFSPKQIQQKQI